MNDLARALGPKAMRTLSQAAGGRQLRIPSMTTDAAATAARSRLVAMVGPDIAEALIVQFARTRLYIPRGASPHNSRTAGMPVLTLIDMRRTMTVREVAAHMRCSERAVHDRLAEFAKALASRDTADAVATRFAINPQTVRAMRRKHRRERPASRPTPAVAHGG